jgi:hypothetical protein
MKVKKQKNYERNFIKQKKKIGVSLFTLKQRTKSKKKYRKKEKGKHDGEFCGVARDQEVYKLLPSVNSCKNVQSTGHADLVNLLYLCHNGAVRKGGKIGEG